VVILVQLSGSLEKKKITKEGVSMESKSKIKIIENTDLRNEIE
jgi:hypothetical protein